ncbi:MAG: hypothetical protein ABI747_00560 [Candidatus Moraniibacteriota bacterium]
MAENKLKKKYLWEGLIFLSLAIGVSLFWLSQGKSYGVVHSVPMPKALPGTVLPTDTTRYLGKNITFLYPLSFQPHEWEKMVKKPLLESFFASESDFLTGQSLALMVQENPTNSLDDFSAHAFRDKSPKIYEKEKIEKNGLKITLFTKNTPVYETGAFFIGERKVVSLVISSSVSLPETRKKLLSILETVEWKK